MEGKKREKLRGDQLVTVDEPTLSSSYSSSFRPYVCLMSCCSNCTAPQQHLSLGQGSTGKRNPSVVLCYHSWLWLVSQLHNAHISATASSPSFCRRISKGCRGFLPGCRGDVCFALVLASVSFIYFTCSGFSSGTVPFNPTGYNPFRLHVAEM